jgi:molybdopterin-guanine dinucleotide biosynthesis protein A
MGVILAGGSGRRLGGQKALAVLGGEPLIAYPLGVMRAALEEVAVVAKPDTALPDLPGVLVWREPGERQHPLVGILEALRRAEGQAVVVCAVDMPFVTVEVIRQLARAGAAPGPGGPSAAVATCDGRLQPHLARYEPSALPSLEAAGPEGPLRELIAALNPVLVEVAEDQLFNVNTPGDLAAAEARLDV